jgi:hypothetical protein
MVRKEIWTSRFRKLPQFKKEVFCVKHCVLPLSIPVFCGHFTTLNYISPCDRIVYELEGIRKELVVD